MKFVPRQKKYNILNCSSHSNISKDTKFVGLKLCGKHVEYFHLMTGLKKQKTTQKTENLVWIKWDISCKNINHMRQMWHSRKPLCNYHISAMNSWNTLTLSVTDELADFTNVKATERETKVFKDKKMPVKLSLS